MNICAIIHGPRRFSTCHFSQQVTHSAADYIWRLYLFESVYSIIIYIYVVYALQSHSLYGEVLRQLNEFIVNRSRTDKNNESSQYNYNKLAFSIYNYAQLIKKKTVKSTILYGERMAVICFVQTYRRSNKSKYNLITIIIIILTSVRSHLARKCCCVRPHWVSGVYLYHITAYIQQSAIRNDL